MRKQSRQDLGRESFLGGGSIKIAKEKKRNRNFTSKCHLSHPFPFTLSLIGSFSKKEPAVSQNMSAETV
jgi:hypothetical protein